MRSAVLYVWLWGAVSGCTGAEVVSPASPRGPESDVVLKLGPALRQGVGNLNDAAPRADLPLRPVATACQGSGLRFDAPTLAHCACVEGSCGAEHPNETRRVDVRIRAESRALTVGNGTRVHVLLVNETDDPVVHRLASWHVGAAIVSSHDRNAAFAPDAAPAVDPKDDEALIEVAPHGSATISIPVAGLYPRRNPDGSTVSAAYRPGSAYIRVFLGSSELYYLPIDIYED